MVKIGDSIKVISVYADDEAKYGLDPNDLKQRLEGKTFTVTGIDDIGNISLAGIGISVNEDVDVIEVIKTN